MNIFEFSSENRVHENEHSAGKIPVCFLVYGDKVRHPSTAKLCLISDLVSINQKIQWGYSCGVLIFISFYLMSQIKSIQ